LALIVRLFHFLLLLIYTGGGGSSKAESLTDKLCTGLFVVVEFFFGVSCGLLLRDNCVVFEVFWVVLFLSALLTDILTVAVGRFGKEGEVVGDGTSFEAERTVVSLTDLRILRAVQQPTKPCELVLMAPSAHCDTRQASDTASSTCQRLWT